MLNLIVDQCTVEAEGTTAMDGIHTTVAGSIKVTNSKFIKNANAINVAMKVPGTMQITVEKCTFEECGLVTTGEGDYRAPIRVVKTGAGTLTATINESTFKDTVGTMAIFWSGMAGMTARQMHQRNRCLLKLR